MKKIVGWTLIIKLKFFKIILKGMSAQYFLLWKEKDQNAAFRKVGLTLCFKIENGSYKNRHWIQENRFVFNCNSPGIR